MTNYWNRIRHLVAVYFVSIVIYSMSSFSLATDHLLIAYNVLTDTKSENYEVFVMQLDGSNKRNITNHKAIDWVYYAYRNRLYFLSDRNAEKREFYLYSMDANGNDLKKISDVRLKDSWFGSRNQGKEFIVNPYGTDKPTFHIIDINGQIKSTLHPPLKFASDPVFSQDGQQIIFRGATKSDKKQPGFIDEIYSMNLQGNNLKQLTKYPTEDNTANWYDYRAGVPRSQVNNAFSYQSFQQGKYSLYSVSEKQPAKKLIDTHYNEGWHDWSSDGKWLAVELFDSEQKQFQIGLVAWPSKELKILTDTTYQYQQAPVFVDSTLITPNKSKD